MTAHSPLISSLPPSCHEIIDFDLVTLDGRLILVGSPGMDRLACTWDPARDHWAQFELDVPDEDFPLNGPRCARCRDRGRPDRDWRRR